MAGPGSISLPASIGITITAPSSIASTIPSLTLDNSTPSSTPTPTSSTLSTVPSQPATTPTPSATAAATSHNGMIGGLPMSQGLAAIITPIAFVVILVPILYMLWLRHRTKRSRTSVKDIPRSDTPAAEARLLRHSPQNSSFLPPPLNETERIKSGSLGVFELRRSWEDHGRAESIGVFHHQSRNMGPTTPPVERGPSPTLPSPKVPAFNRPPSEAWPLPAGGVKLPSPSTLYNPQSYVNKALAIPAPAVTPSPGPPQSPPHHLHPTISNTRTDNSDLLSYASSDVLVAPGASFRPSSSNYDLTPSTGTFPENARATPQQTQRNDQTAPVARSRDSDLVSELSYTEAADRDVRRDTDAISMVSALTNGRRRSERDADALSLVSALSPEEPRIPMKHYPL